jgi:hypothetical protein
MSDPKPPLVPANGLQTQLRYIEKALDHLTDNAATKEQFATVQANINELKATISDRTAGKWVERVVWVMLTAIVLGFFGALWVVIQSGAAAH